MTSIRQHIKRVLNEEKNSLKNDPVKHYYYNYLNEEPIEFKGIYLVPKWANERIEWEVDNPNDYSYGKVLLNDVNNNIITINNAPIHQVSLVFIILLYKSRYNYHRDKEVTV
jgi:spore coat polysaccharide biosynthesis protein SpsF (cytidylyltransferase family)